MSVTLFTGSLCAPVMGFLIDRFPLRLIICCAAGWMALGYVGMHLVTSYVALLLVLIPFQGLGWTGVGPLVRQRPSDVGQLVDGAPAPASPKMASGAPAVAPRRWVPRPP